MSHRLERDRRAGVVVRKAAEIEARAGKIRDRADQRERVNAVVAERAAEKARKEAQAAEEKAAAAKARLAARKPHDDGLGKAVDAAVDEAAEQSLEGAGLAEDGNLLLGAPEPDRWIVGAIDQRPGHEEIHLMPDGMRLEDWVPDQHPVIVYTEGTDLSSIDVGCLVEGTREGFRVYDRDGNLFHDVRDEEVTDGEE